MKITCELLLGEFCAEHPCDTNSVTAWILKIKNAMAHVYVEA